MINVPKTVSNEVISAINALIYESDKFRDWNSPKIQAINDAIGQLQKVDARAAFVARGHLAAICGMLEDVDTFFRKALLHPDQASTKHEYWVALANVGLYSKASELGSWLLDSKRGFFGEVWERAASFGQILAVLDHLSEARKTYREELAKEDFSSIELAAKLMRINGLQDHDVIFFLDLMGEVQRAHGMMFSGEFVAQLRVMTPPEESAYIYFTVGAEAGAVEVRAMNRELARLIVEKAPEGAFPKGLVTTFEKSQPQAVRAAA